MEQRVPYIPDFSDIWNVWKILIMSFFLCLIYSFTNAYYINSFYLHFWSNLQILSPYVITQTILLILFSRPIKALNPFFAILILILLNFFTVYSVHSVMTKTLENFFVNWASSLPKLGVSLGILFFFLVYFDWREKSLHPSEIKAQLNFLQSKMRPHFLFNTLNSIVSLIKKDPTTAKKMLLNLSNLLRASLRFDDNTYFYQLNDEINLCKTYMEIEYIRLGERLNVIWNVEEKSLDAKVPRLSLQPLLENSILHGIQLIEEGGTVSIDIFIDKNNYLNIIIHNPKCQNKQTKPNEHNHITLKNLKQRLMISYEGNYTLNVKDEENKFKISIQIPYIAFSTN